LSGSMDSTGVLSLLEQLDDEIDDLEDSLAPLISHALSEKSAKLPLLDKAKLYVLVTYAIESMLFSYLRLNGVNAREHPVFRELTRVKQYFDKIKVAETPEEKAAATLRIDKAAASRFIKAGLSGNDKYDLQRAETLAKERARAHIKFEELSRQSAKKRKLNPEEEKEKGEAEDADSDSDESDTTESEAGAEVVEEKAAQPAKKRKVNKNPTKSQSTSENSNSEQMKGQKARKRAGKKKNKKEKKERKEKKTKKSTAGS